MGNYRRILVATDFSEQAGKALTEAVRLARKDAAELHFLYVDVIAQQNIEGFDYPPLPDYIRKVDQAAMEALGRNADYHPTALKIVRDTSETGGILRYAAETGIDLIVLGTHGRSALSEFFLGSVAQTVVRKSPVSVLIVGPGVGEGAPRRSGPAFNILAPVDFSARSRNALIHAGALAAERKARLTVLHVVDFDRVAHPEYLEPGEREIRMREQLAKFVAAANLPVAAETRVTIGPGGDEILRMAVKHEADLIVMAASGHGGLERLVLGSVCKAVVRGAPCSVLVHHDSVVLPRSQAAHSAAA